MIDQGYNQNIQTSIAGQITDFTVKPTSLFNGDLNTYTFSLKTIIPLIPGDVISFIAPNSITLPKTNSTNLCFAEDSTQTVTCGISGQNVLVTYQSGANITSLTWSMLNVTNPPSIQKSSGFTKISISDVKSYLVAEFTSESNGVTNVYPANITSAVLF